MGRTTAPSRKGRLTAVLVCATLIPILAHAQPEAPDARRLWTAARIDDLIAGTLDLDIDPSALFREDPAALDPDLPRDLGTLFTPIAPPPRKQARKSQTPQPTTESAAATDRARTTLHDARRRFLSLPADRKERILRAHQDRQDEHAAQSRRAQERTEQAADLAQRAQHLRALVRGELEPAIEPVPLLMLDLSAPWVAEVVQASDATDVDPLVDAGRAVLEALAEFRERSGPERQALLDLHARRQAEAVAAAQAEETARLDASRRAQDDAQQADQERQEALIQAREAASLALREAAEERARLLGVRQAQALFEADLIRRDAEATERSAASTRLETEIRKLAQQVAWGDASRGEADARWPEVRAALAHARTAFRRALDELDHPGHRVPEVGEGLDLARLDESDRTALRELRDALRSEATRLGQAAARARLDHATALSRDVERLNASRLLLLDHVSDGLRDRLTGFGAEGFAQVQGALDQLSLQVRWHWRTLPRTLDEARLRFWQAPLDAVLALIYLAGLLVVFRWWRRQADGLLDRAALHWETRRPPTRLAGAMGTALWYFRRIRHPLEWLALVLLVRLIAGDVAQAPEARIAWLGLKWFLLAGVVVQGVDAVVARFGARTGVHAETAPAEDLRRKSLRLIGLVAIVVGLTLGGIRELLGAGTLHAWVLKMTWVLILPALFLLVRWWKPTIFARIQARPRTDALGDWILARSTGIRGFVAAAIGGAWLLGMGLYRFALTQVAGASAYRRAHAWLFRREVQRHAQLRQQIEVLPVLDGPAADLLAPEGPPDPWIAGPVDAALEDLEARTRQPMPHLAAVVGEHGLGKTAFLQRLSSRLADPANLALACPGHDFDALLGRLADALDLPPRTPQAEVTRALASRNPALITIDDCQRLVRPAIGGLDALARLVALARDLPMRTTWVLALESPAWHFLSRARAPQPMFDRVVRLTSWSEPRIADLLSARTAKAGISPRFDSLLHAVGAPPEAILGEADRTQRGFQRMLWDFSGGNPAVALHFWRESLRQRPDGAVQVALFDAPEATDVESMPLHVLFVLRALVQMEQATPEALAEATRQPLHEVRDVLRFAADAGWLVRNQDLFRLSWQWYRTVTRVLARQHLLVV